jgi:regulatory protein
VARRLRSVRGLTRQKQVNRLAGMLARKGYGTAVAMSVVLEALDGLDPEHELESDGGVEPEDGLDDEGDP